MKFSSCDQDNDLYAGSCATHYGGFWYLNCGGLEINNSSNDGSILYLNGSWHASYCISRDEDQATKL